MRWQARLAVLGLSLLAMLRCNEVTGVHDLTFVSDGAGGQTGGGSGQGGGDGGDGGVGGGVAVESLKPLGDPFEVGSDAGPGDNVSAAVAAYPDGRFAVAWTDIAAPDGDEFSGVRYAVHDGDMCNPCFGRLNEYLPGSQVRPVGAGIRASDSVLFGYSTVELVPPPKAHARLLKAADTLGAEDTAGVGSWTSVGAPWIGFTSAGTRGTAVWVAPDGSGDGISMAYLPGGSLSSGGMQVNSDAAGDQKFPAVAVDSSDRSLVVWVDEGASPYAIEGRIVESDGSFSGSDIVIHSSLADACVPSVAAAAEGFLVAFAEGECADIMAAGGQVHTALVSAAGDVTSLGRLDTLMTGAATQPAVAFTGTEFVVVWRDSPAMDRHGIAMRRLRLDGTPMEATQDAVHEPTQNKVECEPAVAVDAQGIVGIAWQACDTECQKSEAIDFNACNIMMRYFQ